MIQPVSYLNCQPLDDKKPLQKVKYLRIIPKKLRGKDGKKTARAQNGVQQARGDENDVKSNKNRKPKQEDIDVEAKSGCCYFTCMSIGIFSNFSISFLIASKSSWAEGLRSFAPGANRSDADIFSNPSERSTL